MYECRTWALRELDGGKLRDLKNGRIEHPPTDLFVDFIPVVHLPNTPASQTTWGTSVLTSTTQIADDLATNDTDVMRASRYLSDPTVFLTGVQGDIPPVVAPGRMYKGGENGKMSVLDLAPGLEKLMAAGDRLQDRWWQNNGVPAEMVGRVEEGQNALSGVALALRFAPFAQLIGTLRMAREPKYRLLLKFAQRLAQVAGILEAGPTPAARVAFGNFLPTNRAETIDIVTKALNAHAISTQTAVLMLVTAGLPIDDAAEEIARIEREAPALYVNAKNLADATGSEQAAADYLDLDLDGGAAETSPPVPLDE